MRGFAAFVVVMELRQKMPARLDSLRGQVDPALLADARPAWADLRLAAESWQSWRASIDGNAEGFAAEAVSASGEMSTEEARRCSL